MTRTQLIVAAFSIVLVVAGGFYLWPRRGPAPDERAVLAGLSPLLPALARDVPTKPSTYLCDDDANAPCHAVAHTWPVTDESLTLSGLDTHLGVWALGNHLTRPAQRQYQWECNSQPDGRTHPVTCSAPLSTTWARRSVYVVAYLKMTGTGGEIPEPLTRLGSASIAGVAVRAVVYPREQG